MNRKLLYVLMSAGHRHRYAGTTGLCAVCGREHSPHAFISAGADNHVCSVCGKISPHVFQIATSGDYCMKCTICGQTTEHQFTDNGDGTHKCGVCGWSQAHTWVLEKTETVCRGCSVCGATEGHTFTDGICSVCGISQPVTLKGLSARVSIEVKNPPPACLVLSWTGYDGYVVGIENISFSGTVKFYEVEYGGTYRELSEETFTGETTTLYSSWESSPLTNLSLPGNYKFHLNMQISISGNVQVFEHEWEESYSTSQV